MRRERLLVAELIDAAERIVELTDGATVASLDQDRDRREALLWSFTVLGEASSQLDEKVKSAYPAGPLAGGVIAAQPHRARLLADQHPTCKHPVTGTIPSAC